MKAVKETLSKDKLESMKEFSIKESEKILARLQELKEQFETLDEGDIKAKFDIIAESRYLNGKLEGVRLVMEELERIAKIS